MGSLASRPNVPAVQTVYMPVYTPSPSSPAAILPTGQENTAADAPSASGENAAAQRTASLLERRRGVLSTVLTGFRGLLNQTVTPQRKSLLGE
jgi:hypothetical protein